MGRTGLSCALGRFFTHKTWIQHPRSLSGFWSAAFLCPVFPVLPQSFFFPFRSCPGFLRGFRKKCRGKSFFCGRIRGICRAFRAFFRIGYAVVWPESPHGWPKTPIRCKKMYFLLSKRVRLSHFVLIFVGHLGAFACLCPVHLLAGRRKQGGVCCEKGISHRNNWKYGCSERLWSDAWKAVHTVWAYHTVTSNNSNSSKRLPDSNNGKNTH